MIEMARVVPRQIERRCGQNAQPAANSAQPAVAVAPAEPETNSTDRLSRRSRRYRCRGARRARRCAPWLRPSAQTQSARPTTTGVSPGRRYLPGGCGRTRDKIAVQAQTAPIRRRISFSPLPTARGELTLKESSLLASPYEKRKPEQHKAGLGRKLRGE